MKEKLKICQKKWTTKQQQRIKWEKRKIVLSITFLIKNKDKIMLLITHKQYNMVLMNGISTDSFFERRKEWNGRLQKKKKKIEASTTREEKRML